MSHSSPELPVSLLHEEDQELQRQYFNFYLDLSQISLLNGSFADMFLHSAEKNFETLQEAQGEIDNLRLGAQEVVDQTKACLIHLENCLEAAGQSRGAMGSAEAGSENLARNFDKIRGLFQALQENFSLITGRIHNIEDISDKTNLLALNAAIEAARAGVQGGGFNVIAKEIRSLADQSRKNTEEIATALSELNKKIQTSEASLREYQVNRETVVQDIGKTSRNIDETENRLLQANRALKVIENRIERQSEETSSLSRQMEGIKRESEHIVTNVGHIQSTQNYYDQVLEVFQESNETFLQSNRRKADRLRTNEKKSGGDEEENRLLRIGHDASYPPWSYLDRGKPEGISIEITRRIARDLNRIPQFQSHQWNIVLQQLFDEEIDVLTNVGWPNVNIDHENLLASRPYQRFQQRLFVRRSWFERGETLDLSRPENLTIAVQQKTYAHSFVQTQGFRVAATENDIQGMAQLLLGKTDAVATEEKVGEFLSKKFFDEQIVPLPGVLDTTDVVMLFRKDAKALQNLIDQRIAALLN